MITCGGEATVLVDEDGRLWACGYGRDGQVCLCVSVYTYIEMSDAPRGS
jgi:alpha-tubulin suppressor-like RCC1 family protein